VLVVESFKRLNFDKNKQRRAIQEDCGKRKLKLFRAEGGQWPVIFKILGTRKSISIRTSKREPITVNRPWRAIGFWDVEDAKLSRHRLTDGDEDVSHMCRPRYDPQKYVLVLISVRIT
jgi:hypothetical protein